MKAGCNYNTVNLKDGIPMLPERRFGPLSPAGGEKGCSHERSGA